MPYALRIDDVRQDPNGGFVIEYTHGPTPLQSNPMRLGLRVSSVQDIKDMLDDMDRNEAERILFLVLMARFRAVDPDMNTAALIEGRRATFDPATNNVIVVT